MDNNIKTLMEIKSNQIIKALNNNGMNGHYVNSKEDVVPLVKTLIKKEDVLAAGGSMTLIETGVMDFLKSGEHKFLDRNREGITAEESFEVNREALLSDCYFASANAITEKGEIFNVDGNGNRVAATLFGPLKVVLIVGINKLVTDIEEAEKRLKNYTAPANATRLNSATPCTVIGKCCNCNAEGRICGKYTVIKKEWYKDRMNIIIVGENLGY